VRHRRRPRGELIFRYIYEAAGCKNRFSPACGSRRSTADAIRKGFAKLRDGKGLRSARRRARGRSRADWLVG